MTREEKRRQAWSTMPPWQKRFAMTLHRLIEQNGGQRKTASDLSAHGSSITQANLSNYIYGKHIPGLDVVYVLADFFGVSVLEFIES